MPCNGHGLRFKMGKTNYILNKDFLVHKSTAIENLNTFKSERSKSLNHILKRDRVRFSHSVINPSNEVIPHEL